MFKTKKVEILRRKITEVGTSKGIVIPATWLRENFLNLRDDIEQIVTDNYILVKDCRNPIMNELLNDEVLALKSLEDLQDEKEVEAQEWAKKADKILEAGGGQSIGMPIFKDRRFDVNKQTEALLRLSPEERSTLRNEWEKSLKICNDLDANLGTKKET